MATVTPPPFRSFWQPRHWPTWVALGLLFIAAWLPYFLRMGIGKLLGLLTYTLARERRYITTINIRRCFPELSREAQNQLILQTFLENGVGFIESTTGWIRPASHFQELLILSGTEHMDAALAQGRGVLLLGAHYSTLDFSANLLGSAYPFGTTYRPHRNPLFDALMLRGRLRNCNGVFERYDIRGAFRHLKQGKILWYAPDQDYGPEHAVFAPFFGRPAATITATSRFAACNNSPVILIRHHRLDEKRRYVLEFMPVTPPFPSGDDVADATRINQMIESAIRLAPAQYLWMHKRFKTQPYGKPQSPYILVKTPKRKLDETLYGQLTHESVPLRENRLQLRNGLQLWLFAGLPRGPLAALHPVSRLDSVSKRLRSRGLVTVTVDNLFLLYFRRQAAATCHIPRGAPLTNVPPDSLAPALAAHFLARIHDASYHFLHMEGENLLLHNNRLALLDPLCLGHSLFKVGSAARVNDLRHLADLLSFTVAQRAQCCEEYLKLSHSVNREALRALLPK